MKKLGISLVSVLLLTNVAFADTVTVCSAGCDYTKIQDAINAVNNGDTIEVKQGTYDESLTFDDNNDSITLIGDADNVDDVEIKKEIDIKGATNITLKHFKDDAKIVVSSGSSGSSVPSGL